MKSDSYQIDTIMKLGAYNQPAEMTGEGELEASHWSSSWRASGREQNHLPVDQLQASLPLQAFLFYILG